MLPEISSPPASTAAPAAASLPLRRLAAVYFADLVGYTALSARDEAAALALVALLQRLGRELVAAHGGRIVKFVGDALLAEFPSAESAVQSALALDASLRDAAQARGTPASLRTGVHLGELTFAPDGDVYGDGVNVAARLQSEAGAGRVLVSEDVWRQLRRRPAFAFTDAGERELRGHPEPIATYEVGLRYETAPDAAAASGSRPDAAAGVIPERTARVRLIVLPFRVLRPDPDTDFLSFALADAITLSLSGLHSLTLRSSVTGLRYATEPPDLQTLAAQAAVDRVLAGTLLRAGDQLRVSAQLFDAAHGTVLWSETCQAPVGDVFGLQDDITNRIVRSLAPLTARERRLLKRDVPATARAYEFYLRANELAQKNSTWAAARDLYLEALAEDPLYAPAWARLGRCHRLLGKYARHREQAAAELAEAERAYRRAIELNPDLPVAHTLLAQLEAEGGRAPEAMERLLERMRTSGPDPEILGALVHAFRYCGLLPESLTAHAAARRIDSRAQTSVAHTWFVACDYARILAEVEPMSPDALYEMTLATLGRGEEARPLLASVRQQDPTGPFFSIFQAFLDGDLARARELTRQVLEVFPDPEGRYYLARLTAALPEDEGLARIEELLDAGYACADTLVRDPALAALRDDPRFAALRRRAEAMRDRARERFIAADGPAILDAESQTAARDAAGGRAPG